MICRDFHAPCPDAWWTLIWCYHFAGGIEVADLGVVIWVVHPLDTQAYHLGIGWNLLEMLRREACIVIECATPVWISAGFVAWVFAWEVKATRCGYLRVIHRVCPEASQGTAGRICWGYKRPIHTCECIVVRANNRITGVSASPVILHENLLPSCPRRGSPAQAKSGRGTPRSSASSALRTAALRDGLDVRILWRRRGDCEWATTYRHRGVDRLSQIARSIRGCVVDHLWGAELHEHPLVNGTACIHTLAHQKDGKDH